MNILDKIVASKKVEVEKSKASFDLKKLRSSELYPKDRKSLVQFLTTSRFGIISEFKRRSPSKGVINSSVTVSQVASTYQSAGACGLSVLTDQEYFGGNLEDLVTARKNSILPILRKDFVIDPYQIIEARSYGADVILLIARSLTSEQIYDLSKCARDEGLEVLLEIHNQEELDKSPLQYVDLVGVNNRNLDNFTTNIETSFELAKLIPSEYVKVSESGIDNSEDIAKLIAVGYRGFLIGEAFMKTENPGNACRDLIKETYKCLSK